MKSIVYILIAVFAGSILFTAVPQTKTKQKVITIQTTDTDFSATQLEKSANIIESRLDDYGMKGLQTVKISENGSIQFTMKAELDNSNLGFLLLSKGSIDFYETHNSTDVIKAFEANAELTKLIDLVKVDQNKNEYSSIIGFCKPENIEAANKLIEKVANDHGMTLKFLWSDVPYHEGQFVLHMLSKEAAIDKNSIEKTKVVHEKRSNAYQLNIEFNKAGAELWSKITKHNIGKNITITLDDRVLSSPQVMAQITGGKAMISGNFSENDLKLISALANNDDLPLHFTVKQ